MTDLLLGPGLTGAIVKALVVLGVVMGIVGPMVWAERRIAGWIQNRQGPNRVGPFGLLQPLADGLKFIFKEPLAPEGAHVPLYVLAPALSFTAAFTAFAVIPFAGAFAAFGHQIWPIVADLDVGILWVFAVAS